MPDFTGFYPVQLEALKALWKSLHLNLDIPLKCPLNPDGTPNEGVDLESTQGKFRGFNNHYNYTRGKIDCGGLDMLKLLDEVKQDL